MKRRLRRLLALVCALALALSLSGPASAAGDIYFTVINDSVVSLSDSTMPTWSGGVLYVPYSAFDGSNTARIGFDISFSYNRSSGMATLFNTRQFLTFNLNNNTCYNAVTGEYLNGRAILRSGRVFVPVALVCSFFGLSYSVISIDEGYIVRIKDNSVVLSDAKFVEAATLSISRELRAYNQANQSTAAPGVRPPTGSSGETETTDPPIEEEPDTADSVPVYLAFRCDDDQGLSDILDALDENNRAAVFFFPADGLDRQDDLLYRILGSGHSVGLLAEGAPWPPPASCWRKAAGPWSGWATPAPPWPWCLRASGPPWRRRAGSAGTRRCPPSPRRGREPAPTPTRSSAPSPPAASGLISRWTPEASRPGCFPRCSRGWRPGPTR